MKGRRFNISMMVLLAAGLLVGCGHEDEPSLQTEIAVTTHVKGLQKRINSIDTPAKLEAQDIKIDAYFHGTNTKYLDGKKLHHIGGSPAWVFWDGSAQEHYYWPATGTVYTDPEPDITYSSFDFVGACPFTAPAYITGTSYAHATGMSFTCNLASYMTPASQTSMQEYVIAVLNDQTYEDQAATLEGALPMVFKHPFALIKFEINAASGTAVTVNSITIEGLNTAGTCTFDGTTMGWGTYSGSGNMAQTGLSLKYGTSSTETLPYMVIPNTYAAKTLTVNASWTEWSEVNDQNISADVNFNWEPGYIYTYSLTVTPYALKVDISKFTEQW